MTKKNIIIPTLYSGLVGAPKSNLASSFGGNTLLTFVASLPSRSFFADDNQSSILDNQDNIRLDESFDITQAQAELKHRIDELDSKYEQNNVNKVGTSSQTKFSIDVGGQIAFGDKYEFLKGPWSIVGTAWNAIDDYRNSGDLDASIIGAGGGLATGTLISMVLFPEPTTTVTGAIGIMTSAVGGAYAGPHIRDGYVDRRADFQYQKEVWKASIAEASSVNNEDWIHFFTGHRVKYTDPFIIDLNNDGKIELISLGKSRAYFDSESNGTLHRMSWFGPNEGLLVIDKNNDNLITDLSEILSESFDTTVGSTMEAMRLLDSNNDKLINSLDERFKDIKVWQDLNSDGITNSGELKTLEEHNIKEILLTDNNINMLSPQGNIIRSETTVTLNNNSALKAQAVDLLVDLTNYTRNEQEGDVLYYTSDDDGSKIAIKTGSNNSDLNIDSVDAFVSDVGNDTVALNSSSPVVVSSGGGDDNITTGSGNDVISGGQGQDTLNGGSGLDTAIYSGTKSNFTITNNSGTWTVTDNRSDANINLGTDTLTNIERIRFDDEVIHTDNTNNNPIVVGGEMTTRGNQPLTITTEELLNTATDIDGDYLTLTQIGNTIGGSASIDQSGNVIFTPQENFTGKASFDYKVDDGHGGTATGTAEINILSDLPTDQWFADQWYLKAANVVPVWDEYSGKGVTVGILDDGITNHADLNVNIDTDLIKRGYVDESSQPFLNTGGDAGSHGTFLAGIIAGLRNDQGIVGVAYDAMVKAYVTYGDKSFERQLEVDIYNNSWMYIAGSDPTMYSGEAFGHITNELVSVVQNGRDGLGGVVVASAGNLRVSGENTNYFELMNSRYSITVGGADSLGQYLPFSTAGANVHVVAPGSDITSTDIEGPGGYSNDPDGKTAYGSDYFNSQGNSFATPIVSGVTALMLEANADLGWRDVKEILAYSAVNSDASHTGWRANAATNWNGGGLHYSHDYGFGMVDALAAVRLAESWGKEADISDNEIKVSAQSDVGRVVTNDETGIYSQVEIGSGVEIDQIEVELDMSDTDFSDLQVTLISPDGTGSILIDQPGSKGKNTIKWTLSSGHFIGESGIGVWTLHIVDKKSGDKAVLNSWKLNLYGGEPSDDDVYVYTNEYGRFIEEAYETRGVLNDKEGTDTINAAVVSTLYMYDNFKFELRGMELWI